MINTKQIKIKIIQKINIQKLQFALTSLHNLQKNLNNNKKNKKTSNSDNKSKQNKNKKKTNVDI